MSDIKTKLSFSQINKFGMCPKSFEYHYKQKIRPIVFSAALAFGSALDEALNSLLTNGRESPESVFTKAFTYNNINGKDTYLPTCSSLVYAEADFDEELINVNEEQSMRYQEIRKKKKEIGFENLSEDDKVFYNELNWQALNAKGLLMLKVYRKKVLPLIEKVHAVQKYVQLDNESGDKIIGYVDLIADIKGYGTCVIDHKTSAREYEQDSVLYSPQLALYMHALEKEFGTRKAGFIVLRKGVIKNRKKTCTKCSHDGSGSRAKTCDNTIEGKRCNGTWHEEIDPDIFVQILINEVPEVTEQIVMENFDDVNKAIKSGVFTRNFGSCDNTYGGECCYKKLCFLNCMKGLVKV